MNINFTVIIQMLNFWITFIFLKYILLQPFIKAIAVNKKTQLELSYMITNIESAIAQIYYEKQLHWQDFRQYCNFNQPLIDKLSPILMTNIEDNSEQPSILITEKTAQLHIQMLTQKVVSKLKDGSQ
ncbi:hypothetical protein IPH25_01440 [bacterium]|nr:MAG: hypothetical protein IPG37_03565 [bacterium]QQR62091.1 MAG: hypothetical protein IPH25_01440 [bacterium]QQR63352.1 MAG: hypothetical protein IPH67_02680 [bacterium]